MEANTGSKDIQPPASAEDLTALVAAVRDADRLLARAVVLAGRLAASGVAERIEGLPLEHYVGLAARLTGADRRMLVAAGETLQDLPAVAGLFLAGTLSWGQVRAIVLACKTLPRAKRQLLDTRVAATVATHADGLEAFDPDGLVWAVDAAAEELRDPRTRERAEQRAITASFLARQANFDGGMRLYGELDPLTAAPISAALDAAAGRPVGTADTDPDPDPDADRDGAAGSAPGANGVITAEQHVPDVDGVAVGTWTATGKARQDAQALATICGEWLGGGPGRPARPLIVANVDIGAAAQGTAGTVELAVRGDLPRISAATLEALATTADVRAVLFDGKRPLATTRKVNAADVPADVAFATKVRDRGCRFPGSSDPLAHTDTHHTIWRSRGGDHHPDRLVSLSRRWHTITHRHGWAVTITPDSGMVTISRNGRRWHSLPRGTGLAPAPDPPDQDSRPPPPPVRGSRSHRLPAAGDADPTIPF